MNEIDMYDTYFCPYNPKPILKPCEWGSSLMCLNCEFVRAEDEAESADIDKYDTNCPYNNKPCLGCGSFFTECPRCVVEKEVDNG